MAWSASPSPRAWVSGASAYTPASARSWKRCGCNWVRLMLPSSAVRSRSNQAPPFTSTRATLNRIRREAEPLGLDGAEAVLKTRAVMSNGDFDETEPRIHTNAAFPGPSHGQAAQDLHVRRVRALAIEAGHLQDERHPLQPWIMQQSPESRLPNLALADVGVAVTVGTQPGLRVVAVDDLELLQPHHPFPLVQSRPGGLGRALVVARRERVAGVEAGGNPRVADRVHHDSDLLEASAHTAAHPGVVLDQEASCRGIGPLHHPLQVPGDGWQGLLKPDPLVTARMEDHPADA